MNKHYKCWEVLKFSCVAVLTSGQGFDKCFFGASFLIFCNQGSQVC